MKLSISNIAWGLEQDKTVYSFMKKLGFDGLEIAPTRIFPENPYEDLSAAKKWAEDLKNEYGFLIPSMQSIWFGKSESIFGSDEERNTLIEYTKKAILFAKAIDCKNLVFGCPRNRNMPEGVDRSIAIDFFREIADFAYENGRVIGMEANPPIYNTNFINTTAEALELIREVDSKGFMLNLDMGTMIENNESIDLLRGNVQKISHVHISEPGLVKIEKREIHKALISILKLENYEGFVSIEMGNKNELPLAQEAMEYLSEDLYGSN